MNVTDLKHEELVSICGGHEGFWYTAGALAVEGPLFVLGVLAGIGEGLFPDDK